MRARPDMLDVSDEEEFKEELSEDKKNQQKAISKSKYQAPKLIPMEYNENEEEKKAKQVRFLIFYDFNFALFLVG